MLLLSVLWCSFCVARLTCSLTLKGWQLIEEFRRAGCLQNIVPKVNGGHNSVIEAPPFIYMYTASGAHTKNERDSTVPSQLFWLLGLHPVALLADKYSKCKGQRIQNSSKNTQSVKTAACQGRDRNQRVMSLRKNQESACTRKLFHFCIFVCCWQR